MRRKRSGSQQEIKDLKTNNRWVTKWQQQNITEDIHYLQIRFLFKEQIEQCLVV